METVNGVELNERGAAVRPTFGTGLNTGPTSNAAAVVDGEHRLVGLGSYLESHRGVSP